MYLGGSDLPLPLVEHLDITTERKSAQYPFRTVPAQFSFPENATKTDREAQDLHTTPACRQIVAQFMDNDQDADDHREGGEIERQLVHAKRKS